MSIVFSKFTETFPYPTKKVAFLMQKATFFVKFTNKIFKYISKASASAKGHRGSEAENAFSPFYDARQASPTHRRFRRPKERFPKEPFPALSAFWTRHSLYPIHREETQTDSIRSESKHMHSCISPPLYERTNKPPVIAK